MSRQKPQKIIRHQGLPFPEFLFYSSTRKSQSIPPEARFDPISAAASDSEAFQSSSSPSSVPLLKTIVVDDSSFPAHMDQGQIVAFIRMLQLAGFKVYAPIPYLKDLQGNLKSIARFKLSNQSHDEYYEALAGEGVARDNVLIMDRHSMEQIEESIAQGMIQNDRSYNSSVMADGWQWMCLRSIDDKLGEITDSAESPAESTEKTVLLKLKLLFKSNRSIGHNGSIGSFMVAALDDALRTFGTLSFQIKVLKIYEESLDTEDRDLLVGEYLFRRFNPILKSQEDSLSYNILYDIIKAFPNASDQLLDQNFNIILSSSELRYFIKNQPVSIVEKILIGKEGYKRIDNQDNLLAAVTKLGNHADFLIEKCMHTIVDDGTRFEILKYADQTVENLLAGYSPEVNPDNFSAFVEFTPKFTPGFAKYLLLKHPEFILSGYHLSKLMAALPERAEELLLEHGNKINSGYELAKCIVAAPHFKDKLLADHKDKIKDGHELAECLSAAPEDAEWLFKDYNERCRGFYNHYEAESCLKAAPKACIPLVNYYHIENGYNLVKIVSYLIKDFPDLARLIMEKNLNKIEDGFQLAECIKLVPELAEKFLLDHDMKILTSLELFRCLEAAPNISVDFAMEMLASLRERISFDANDVDTILQIVKKLPIRVQVMIEDFYGSKLQDKLDIKVPDGDVEAYKKSTYLQISLLDPTHLRELLEQIQTGCFDNVVAINICQVDENFDIAIFKELIGSFERRGIKIECLRVPTQLEWAMSDDIRRKYMVQVIKPEIDFGIFDIEGKKHEIDYHENQSEEIIPFEDKRPNKQGIYVSKSTVSRFYTGIGSGIPKFNMSLAGEVLNSTSHVPQIRVSQIQNDILRSTKEKEYVPMSFRAVETRELLPDDLEDLRFVNDGNHYYSFTCSLKKGKRFRLLSVSDTEKLHGVVGNVDGLEIAKGDDGFLYATAKSDRTISYVLKAPQKIKTYADLSPDNIIRREVEDYIDPQKGYLHKADEKRDKKFLNSYRSRNHQQWMEELYRKRAGVCRHRRAAMEFHLLNVGVDPQDIRAINIDGNHEVLEVRQNGEWYKIDLGGGDADLRYSNKPYVGGYIMEQVSNMASRVTPFIPGARFARAAVSSFTGLFFRSKKRPLLTNITKRESGEIGAIRRAEQQGFQDALMPEETEIISSTLIGYPEFSQSGVDLEKLLIDHHKILFVNKEVDKAAINFLKQAKDAGRAVFYIDSPNQINFNIGNIFIEKDHAPVLSFENSLRRFLRENSDPNNPPLIMINWDRFDTKQQVALNTLLDLNPSISGVRVLPQTQIISFRSKEPGDQSFRSRHDYVADSQSILFSDITQFANQNQEASVIDLQGFPKWRQQLFGSISMDGDLMRWNKSEFVIALEAGETNFRIDNISASDAAVLDYEFKKAIALGEIEYCGYKIPLPQNLIISCQDKEFDFSKFASVDVLKGVTLDRVGSDATLINTQIFDLLLNDRVVEGGLYKETKGLIESRANDTLPLFITSNLSANQWYCLFNQAKKFNVTPLLYLAPGVELPTLLKTNDFSFDAGQKPNLPQLIVSNNTAKTAEALRKDSYAVIDVEDLTYQDLVGKIVFKKSENGFKDFEYQTSEFIQKLQAGEKIVLKGKFSPDLLQMLEPLLIGKFGDFSKNLTIIIEDKVGSTDAIYQPLSWLPNNSYKVESYKESEKSAPRIIAEPNPSRVISSNPKEGATNFLQLRKDILFKELGSENIIELVGYSGVGKSGLMRMLEEQDSKTIEVTREMHNFRSWAQDPRLKTKILFIDESNIDDTNYSFFSELKKGGNRRVFYDGEFFDLDKYHKVVFARNPLKFGGGRVVQKLFEDNSVPQFHLKDFPADYIYEVILKEEVYDKLSAAYKKIIPEKHFREVSQKLLDKYYQANDLHHQSPLNPELTVRELQEQALTYLIENVGEEIKIPQLESENFVSTSATKEAEKALNYCFMIRNEQRQGRFAAASGINGVLLEGDSGIGKSEMINAFLREAGVEIVKGFGDGSSSSQVKCYKIDAALPLKEKEKIITKAFEEGNLVWIDELNSCIDDGLEKILNKVLTGEHPSNKSAKPGFMLIASTNPIHMEGRSMISPALEHRLAKPKMKKLSEYTKEDFKEIIGCWMKGTKTSMENIDKAAERCCFKTKDNPALNLRSLRREVQIELSPHIIKPFKSTQLQTSRAIVANI